MARSRGGRWNPMETKWDKFMFVLTYTWAVFATIAGAAVAEPCNTTTISVFGTVTEVITSALTTSAITVANSSVNGTVTTFPALSTGTSTVTEITTLTLGGETGSQSAPVMSSDSTSILTVTSFSTSYLSSTVTNTRLNGTRVSVPESLSLTFPIVTASAPCTSDCSTANGSPFPLSNATSTQSLTSTTTAAVETSTYPRALTPSWGAPESITRGPTDISETSEATSIIASIIAQVNSTSTTTFTSFVTVTASGQGAVVSPIESVLSAATSLLGGASSEIATVTHSTTVTRTPVESILSAVSSHLSVATSELATSPANTGTLIVTVFTTVSEVHTTVVPAPTGFAVNVTLSSAETQILTDVLTVTAAVPKFSNSTSTVTVFNTIPALAAPSNSTTLVNKTTTVSSTVAEVTSTVHTSISTTLANETTIIPSTDSEGNPAFSTSTSTTLINETTTVFAPTVLSTVSALASEVNASTSTVTFFSTISDAVSAVNTSTSAILSNETTTVLLHTTVTADIPAVTTASSLSVPVSSVHNSSTTSKATVTHSSTNTITDFSATSVSTAMPLYNSTLTGGAFSPRVPRVFGFLGTVLSMTKNLVVAANDGDFPRVPVLAVPSSESLTTSPMSSVPAHPAPVSISTSTTTESCVSTAGPKYSTTITLPTTITINSTVFSTLTTSIPGAVPPASANTSVSVNNATSHSIGLSIPLPTFSMTFPPTTTENSTRTYSSPVFGQNVTTHPFTSAAPPTHAQSTSTVTMTLSKASPTSGVGRVEVTAGLLVLVGVVAWIVL